MSQESRATPPQRAPFQLLKGVGRTSSSLLGGRNRGGCHSYTFSNRAAVGHLHLDSTVFCVFLSLLICFLIFAGGTPPVTVEPVTFEFLFLPLLCLTLPATFAFILFISFLLWAVGAGPFTTQAWWFVKTCSTPLGWGWMKAFFRQVHFDFSNLEFPYHIGNENPARSCSARSFFAPS